MGQYQIGIILVLVAATLWGTTGTAAAMAPELGPIAIGAAAMGGGGLIQAFLARQNIRAQFGLLRAHWKLVAIGALGVFVYPLTFYASMRLAGVTVGTVVSIGAAPLISAVIERVVEGTRLSRRWQYGAALGLVGLVLLAREKGGQGALGDQVGWGVVLGLLAAATYALYTYTARALMGQGLTSRAAMGATFGVGGLLLLPVFAATGASFFQSGLNASVGLYMMLGPMVLGYLAFGAGLARLTASTATTLTLWEPVVAALLAVNLLGERLAPAGWLGIGLVIGCLVILSWPSPVRDK